MYSDGIYLCRDEYLDGGLRLILVRRDSRNELPQWEIFGLDVPVVEPQEIIKKIHLEDLL